jgi:hypothetical protein
MASRLQRPRRMEHEPDRRCALWVSPRVLAAAQELAELVGLDVDSFVAMVVLDLSDQESAERRLRARAAEVPKPASHVIPIAAAKRARRTQQAVGSGTRPVRH